MKIFNNQDLVPQEWSGLLEKETCYIFNPAITLFCNTLLMAYRVVLSDGVRRMAICRLDDKFDIIPGSVVSLSDAIQDADDWQADPRFCTFAGRLYLHFNNGFRRPNQIYLLELNPDTLLPLGATRPLILAGPRQIVEKNWMLFDDEKGNLLAVYRIAPHVVIRLSLDETDSIPCVKTDEIPWDSSRYSSRFGVLHGGTPPVRVEGVYYSFFHSVYLLPYLHRVLNRLLHGSWVKRYRYAVGFYGFSAHPPFRPVCFSPFPVMQAPPRTVTLERQLNRFADRVVYPSGAVFFEGNWTVSFGLHDEHCCLITFSHEKLLAETLPIPAPEGL